MSQPGSGSASGAPTGSGTPQPQVPTKQGVTPEGARQILEKLHDSGIINIDTPLRQTIGAIDAKALGLEGPEVAGWYAVIGSGCCVVVK